MHVWLLLVLLHILHRKGRFLKYGIPGNTINIDSTGSTCYSYTLDTVFYYKYCCGKAVNSTPVDYDREQIEVQ